MESHQEPPAPPSQAHPSKPRLVVVESVYHQAPNEQPAVVESRYGRWLGSDEQPFGPRNVSVGSGWEPVEHGWLDAAGMLVIQHRQGADLDVGIEAGPVGVVPFAVIRQGESTRFTPYRLSNLRVRSLSGTTRYSITLMPE